MEARLGIAPWDVPPNANNEALARGAASLGIKAVAIRRNVKDCWNLGYCGLGCPVNAKQSMLLTTVPAALDRGATLVTRARALEFVHHGDRVTALSCAAMDTRGVHSTARRLSIRARAFVAAGGAIGTPALLLRSRVPDPHASSASARSCIRPSCPPPIMPEQIDPFAGAPQTIYSDHFLDVAPIDGPIGYKLEAAPAHPLLMAITLPGQGRGHASAMRELPHLHVALALLRDGFHPDSPGGTVTLDASGAPVLDYPLNAIPVGRRASRVSHDGRDPVRRRGHERHAGPRRWRRVRRASAPRAPRSMASALAPLATPVMSAHVMGGCPLGPDPARAAVDIVGPLSPSRESSCSRRLAVPDLDRRESAAFDLRHRRAPRNRAGGDAFCTEQHRKPPASRAP